MPELPDGRLIDDYRYLQAWKSLRYEIREAMMQAAYDVIEEKQGRAEITDKAAKKMIAAVNRVELI